MAALISDNSVSFHFTFFTFYIFLLFVLSLFLPNCFAFPALVLISYFLLIHVYCTTTTFFTNHIITVYCDAHTCRKIIVNILFVKIHIFVCTIKDKVMLENMKFILKILPQQLLKTLEFTSLIVISC